MSISSQSGDLATSSSELAVARVRIWLAELAVPNTGLAVLLRFAKYAMRPEKVRVGLYM